MGRAGNQRQNQRFVNLLAHAAVPMGLPIISAPPVFVEQKNAGNGFGLIDDKAFESRLPAHSGHQGREQFTHRLHVTRIVDSQADNQIKQAS